jgi:hypothetical protein
MKVSVAHIPKGLSVGKNRLITKIKRKYLDVLSVPVVKCRGCGEFIVLGNTYWNINDVDIKCNRCRMMDTTKEQNLCKSSASASNERV